MNIRFLLFSALILQATVEVRAGLPDLHVWFEATGANPASTVTQQGVQGDDLIVECDTTAGPTTCEWDLSMIMSWDTAPLVSVISSAATDFLGDSNKHTMSNFQVGNYPLDGFAFTEVNAGGVLADTRAVQVPVSGDPPMFEVIPQGEYTLLTARLTTQKGPGDLQTDGIDMQINSLLWTFTYDPDGPIGSQPLIQFGDADAIFGDQQGGLADDVIIIRNVPEPTTIGLLIFGLTLIVPKRRIGFFRAYS
ncbi:MAG: PEP-CTERM sorting domain-containing protein [Phycisphaerales bacterium]|nr:PEP-CTERM sorting domain-containing protein [Phycisphaerales bacterium]